MSKVPYVSVIIPCYNERERIRDCLMALAKQVCDFPYEVIVVDDGSNDGTVEVVRKLIEELRGQIQIRIIAIDHGGPAKARNTGIRNALGTFLLFIDADCRAGAFWIETLVRYLESTDEVVGVEGTYRTMNADSRIAFFTGLDIEYRHSEIGPYTDFVGSYNSGFRKKILLKVGGFDEDFTEASSEDNDLSYRLGRAGYKLAYNPNAWVLHNHPSTLKSFVQKQFKRAMWRVLLYKKHPRKISGDKYAGLRTLAQPLIIAVSALFTILTASYNYLLSVSSPIIGLSAIVVMNMSFLRWIYSKYKEPSLVLLCLSMTILRAITWSLGTLAGIIKFVILHKNTYTWRRKRDM